MDPAPAIPESHAVATPSLPEVHRSVIVPAGAGFWRKLLAFSGPGFLVAVGYMDPGNWATDIAGGSRFAYQLISVLMISNLIAILVQALAARLGIATQMDLAQACKAHYSRRTSFILWVLCEIAIAACDLAEVIGSAIALNLLFHIPLLVGVCLTALDVLAILYLQHKGFRYLEAVVVTLIGIIGGCYLVELLLVRPNVVEIAKGFVPTPQILTNPEMLYIAIGILGATVMPHNLYLHSSLVQTRAIDRTPEGMKTAMRYNFLDSFLALNFAFLINAAILIMAAGTFFRAGYTQVAEIQEAYHTLTPLLGTKMASHPVCGGLALFRAELHLDRNPGGPDRYGGISQPAARSLAAPVDHAPSGHHPGSDCGDFLRPGGDGQAPDLQPGHPEPATLFRRRTPGAVYERPAQDGRIRQPAMAENPGVDHGRDHRAAECVSFGGDGSRLDALIG